MERRYIDSVRLNKPLDENSYLRALPAVKYLMDNERLSFDRDVTLFVQVGTREGDRREGVPSRRFDGDIHVGAEQVQDGGYLGAGGRDGDTGLRVHGADLAVDALDHRFIASVRAFEELDKLLGSHIIGQRPQPLAGAAGKQNDIHK